jgi:hypothetical protein
MDVLAEQQIKLGYLKETVRLYYPLESLNQYFKREEESRTCTVEEMEELLKQFSEDTRERLGGIEVSRKKDRFCLAVPPAGITYVHEHMEDKSFLVELITLLGKHGISFEDVLELFRRFSDQVHVEAVDNGEFDYLVYFENGEPDSYRYCFSVEECHIIYHRYTEMDYVSFGF